MLSLIGKMIVIGIIILNVAVIVHVVVIVDVVVVVVGRRLGSTWGSGVHSGSATALGQSVAL